MHKIFRTVCHRVGSYVAKPHLFHFLPNRKKMKKGFTLIEVMVVVIILGILATLIVPRIMSRPEEAKRTKTQLQIRSIESALKLYKLDNGDYPTTEQGLDALVKKPETGILPKNWRKGGYLESTKVPKDPWGNDFIYVMPGQYGDFDLSSYGHDGQKGGEEENADINNWDLE
jgi:general secretion pathway protein G